MRFGVLGPVAVWTTDGRPVTVPGLKVRALLAALLAHDGRPVSGDRLIDLVWGDDLPGNPAGTLSAKASQLRRALDQAEPGARALVGKPPPGYHLAAEDVDVRQFAELIARAKDTTSAPTRAALLAEALGLWRGDAYADFADNPFIGTVAAGLEEQRLVAVEDLAEARLAAGAHAAVAGELATTVAQHPLRERLRALHILALYRSGRPTEALDSYAALRAELADELGLDPGPELADLQRRILNQDPALSEAATAGEESRGNLPAVRTVLIGRAVDVAGLHRVLGEERLVTLIGSGGVGKTRLALEVAARQPGEVWLVELAALVRPDVPETMDALADLVRSALDLHDDATPGEPLAKLVAALRARSLLLVLDNCEHLLDQAAALADALLRAAPGVRILATSRESLRIAGEVAWPVNPLDPPSAVELFVARAAAAARGFALDDDNTEAVATLCRRLDGIPLALELAATRVRALGVHGIVARLDDRFRLLAVGHRGAPPRQQTLLAMIDWSWELLSAPERAVLRRLSVYVDGFTADSVDDICADEDGRDIVAALVDRSLVIAEPQRYRLLESVAAFCADRLAEAGEQAETRRRFCAYYADLAERAEPHLRGPGQRQWLQRLDAEAGNLRAALDAGDLEVKQRLAQALTWYWFLRGRLAEARRARQAAGLDDAWTTGIRVLLGEKVDVNVAEHQPRAAAFLAFATADLGDVRRTEALIDRAIAKDPWATAVALAVRCKLHHVRGDLDGIERDGNRSCTLFRELGDRWGLLLVDEWLGGLAELRGEYEKAARLQLDGLRLAEDLELWPDVAGRLAWLGFIALQRLDFRSARDFSERALNLMRRQGYASGEVFAELVVAFAARREGRFDVAEHHLNHLVAGAQPDSTPLFLPVVLVELGYLEELRGNAEAARVHHLEAIRLGRKLDAPRDLALGYAALAAVTDPAEGARLLGAAAAVRAKANMPCAPAEQSDVDRITAAVRAALGAAAFDAGFAEGYETDG
jgi:predicted ATPase/DNA-binding SARP family transcriptional activator